jgi:hypothetical protein
VTGLFVISTQGENSILIPETIKAKQAGTPAHAVLQWIRQHWYREHHGQTIYELIMDNKIDFKNDAIQYVMQNPLTFVKYHILGSIRVLFGTARNHLKTCFTACANWSENAWKLFNLGMISYYFLIYLALLLSFRSLELFDPVISFSWLFIIYNIGLIGVLAYTTGGGLKRAPFIPFLIIALAGQFAYLLRTRKKSKVLPIME